MLMTISNTDFLELCPKRLMMMTMIINQWFRPMWMG